MAVNRNAELAQAYANAVASNDFDALERLRTPDWVEDWPQSGERLVGHERYRAIHERFPGGYPDVDLQRVVGTEDRWVVTPSMTVQRVTGSGDLWVIEGVNTYSDGTRYQIVAVIELHDGRVRHQRTYFAQAFEPPPWRAEYVETV